MGQGRTRGGFGGELDTTLIFLELSPDLVPGVPQMWWELGENPVVSFEPSPLLLRSEPSHSIIPSSRAAGSGQVRGNLA